MITPYSMFRGFPMYDDDGFEMPDPDGGYPPLPEAPGENPSPISAPPPPSGSPPGSPPSNPTGNPPNTYMPQGGAENWLQSFLRSFSGGGGGGMNWAMILPALASAWQQYQNSGDYLDLGREAADRASPVSNDTRRRYQDRLDQLYTNPEAFLQGNPEYMANMRLGTDKLASANRARGLGGSGAATTDQLRFLSDLSSRYINQERDDLMNMSGFQFDPSNSARFLMEGGKLSLDAKNSALAALLYPFGRNNGDRPNGNNSNNRNPGGGPSGPGGGGSPPGGWTPQNVTNLARSLGVTPGDLWNAFGNMPAFGIDRDTALSLLNQGVPQMMGWDPLQPSTWNLEDDRFLDLINVPGISNPGLSMGPDDLAKLPWWLGGDGSGGGFDWENPNFDWGSWLEENGFNFDNFWTNSPW